MRDNPRHNPFIRGLTIARRSLAQCNSNTNMTAAGISTGNKVVIDSSQLRLLLTHKSLMSFTGTCISRNGEGYFVMEACVETVRGDELKTR